MLNNMGDVEMKKCEINYDGMSFEEKIILKINYLLSLPASIEVKSALLNLQWVLDIYNEEKLKKEKVRTKWEV